MNQIRFSPRSLAASLVLAAGLLAARPAQSQWEIFAENPPPPGNWAKFDMMRKKANGHTEHTEVTIAVTGAETRDGKALVWLEVHPTKWLGSKKKGALKFLIPADMSRAQAAQLMRNALEIVFQEPGKTAYFMTPADVARNAKRAGLEQHSDLTPAAPESITLPLGKFDCQRSSLNGKMVIDPPMVAKSTTTLNGTVWHQEGIPFRVVKVAWKETNVKGDENETETKMLTLVAHGASGAQTRAPNRGETFSLWRLLKR